MAITHITVRGARQHNLRNLSVSIPRNTLTVVTGLSGSGKSSLAFDTIYAEGQRRYVETLSAYARQFLDQMERPDVDAIDGLSPAISIEQKTTSRSPRSTVGTITEIYDYLRLLYASVGQPHCPKCGLPITRQTADQIVERIVAQAPGERITVYAPLVRGRKGEFREELEALDQQGFRARIDGAMTELTEGMRLDKRKNHTVEAVVDRIILKPLASNVNETASTSSIPCEPRKFDTRRLETSVAKALQMAKGLVLIGIQGANRAQVETLYSSSMACPDCGIDVPRLEPRSFSFNSAYGACPQCNGLGSTYDFDPAKTITDWSKPLLDGAMGPGSGVGVSAAADPACGGEVQDRPEAALFRADQAAAGPAALRAAQERAGTDGLSWHLRVSARESRRDEVRRLPRVHDAVHVRDDLPALPGPAAASGVAGGDGAIAGEDRSIAEFTALSLERALECARAMHFTGRDRIVADRLQREIVERLEFLNAVGLDYLSLDRSAATLSGGEGQRIRLATQIGSRLRGVLYVLDEPSIGLHQRDNRRLIQALTTCAIWATPCWSSSMTRTPSARPTMCSTSAPARARTAGMLIAAGTPQQVMDNPASLTGQYLAGKIEIVARAEPRPLTGKWITVENATAHNLQQLTAHFPLGVMTVVTGVSGSGKSTLVTDILYRALAKELYGSREDPGAHGRVVGIDQIDKVIEIDQSPIGRTPRSNPATYTGVFTAIRDLFAMLPESRERGYKPGRFSFNVRGGRCEACQGEGQRRIEMNFLPDVYVLCDICNGRRYNQETLAVRYNGHSIADLLDLPIADALPVLKDIPRRRRSSKRWSMLASDTSIWASRRPHFLVERRSA